MVSCDCLTRRLIWVRELRDIKLDSTGGWRDRATIQSLRSDHEGAGLQLSTTEVEEAGSIQGHLRQWFEANLGYTRPGLRKNQKQGLREYLSTV